MPALLFFFWALEGSQQLGVSGRQRVLVILTQGGRSTPTFGIHCRLCGMRGLWMLLLKSVPN
jgi:hypothetical protein